MGENQAGNADDDGEEAPKFGFLIMQKGLDAIEKNGEETDRHGFREGEAAQSAEHPIRAEKEKRRGDDRGANLSFRDFQREEIEEISRQDREEDDGEFRRLESVQREDDHRYGREIMRKRSIEEVSVVGKPPKEEVVRGIDPQTVGEAIIGVVDVPQMEFEVIAPCHFAIEKQIGGKEAQKNREDDGNENVKEFSRQRFLHIGDSIKSFGFSLSGKQGSDQDAFP